jgi:ATP-dependent DNA helicase RecG
MGKIAELVNLQSRAETAISLGESHFREFKSALHGSPGSKAARATKEICRDIGETLVAFVNADGGELLVGVEDNGQITGVEDLTPGSRDALMQAPKTQIHLDTPLPPVRQAILTLDGHEVMYFSVQQSVSNIYLTSDGKCLQRRDLASVPKSPTEILADRGEIRSKEYDRAYVDGASPANLKIDLVRILANQLSPGMSPEKCLQYLDLAEYTESGLRLRKGALLLFATEPQKWHPRLQVRILKIRGNELKSGPLYNVINDQTISGNLLELLELGWEALRPVLVQTSFGADARFANTTAYPEFACREALVNAIAHRDYSEEGRGIELYIFDDRIRSPGKLLSAVTVEELRKQTGIHQSRNAYISRVLRELGYMRELGEGMRRIFHLMAENELQPPELLNEATAFSVVLHHNTIYTTEQKLWLEQFSHLPLNREQKTIVVLGLGGRLIAPHAIIERLGIVDIEHYRQLIQSLQDLGVLISKISKQTANTKARKNRVSVRQIPRFSISVPSVAQHTNRIRIANEKVDDPGTGVATVYIGNLNYTIESPDLVDFLNGYGQVVDLNMPIDSVTKRKRGFAFAEFANAEEAERVISQVNGVDLAGRPLVVRPATPRS